MSPLLRRRDNSDAGRVATIELFFDLVFVFAADAALPYAGRGSDAHGNVAGDRAAARGLVGLDLHLLGDQLARPRTHSRAGLPAGAACCGSGDVGVDPHAFDELGLYFGARMPSCRSVEPCSFCGRCGAALIPAEDFQRIVVWFGTSAAFWIAGAYADGWSRFGLWLVALAIECAGPWLYGGARSRSIEHQ